MSENPWRTKWTPGQLTAMLIEQQQAFWKRETGLERDCLAQVERAASIPHAVIISGLRRVGKSTLLAQLAHRLGEDHFYYLDFEDDRFLGFQADDATFLYQHLVELYGERRIFLVDEIQNVPGWERFVRRFMDLGLKFYITGSNAALLSRELGTRLTGRYLPVELFPFSFDEYRRWRGIERSDPARLTTAEAGRLQGLLGDYLRQGGLPESLKYPELDLGRGLYEDVLYRDIATRYHLEAVRALKELAFYLMSNPARLVSYNKLKAQLQLGSVNTVKNFIEYLENSWLLFTVNVHDHSVKRQQIAPKKVFAIDTGLAQAVAYTPSPDTGHLLENTVYLALRRRTSDIFYWAAPNGQEVDFYLPGEKLLIQVAASIDQPAPREREIRGLNEAMQALRLKQGLLLTGANAAPVTMPAGTIQVRAAAEWLLSPA
jgi:predicted AAA+ superfamily ATPase